MGQIEIERYEHLATLTARIARASAELQCAQDDGSLLPTSQRDELEELTDRLQALHVLLANEVERAWNAAEAAAQRDRRAQMMGRVHDAVSAETTLPDGASGGLWQELGPFGPEGPAIEGLGPAERSG